MFFRGLQLLSCLSLLASHVSSTVLTQNATYDTLDYTPVAETAIGTYKGLIYKAWVVGGPITPGLAIGGVANQSPPNCALTGADTELTNGTPTMTIAKPYKSFSLLDFFFGCVARTDEGTVGVALQCTITIAGFLANTDQEVALGSFTFTPPLKPLTPVPMIRAVLPSSFLQPLYNATIVQDNNLAALRIDNLHYTLSS